MDIELGLDLSKVDLATRVDSKEMVDLGPKLRQATNAIMLANPNFSQELHRLVFAGELFSLEPAHAAGGSRTPRAATAGYEIEFPLDQSHLAAYTFRRSPTGNHIYPDRVIHNIWDVQMVITIEQVVEGRGEWEYPSRSFTLSWQEYRSLDFKLTEEANYTVSAYGSLGGMNNKEQGFGGDRTYGALKGSQEILDQIKLAEPLSL